MAKSATVFFVIAGLIVLVALLIMRAQQSHDLEVISLHERWRNTGHLLKSCAFTKSELKAEKKKAKKEQKGKDEPPTKTYVIRFAGDLKAHQVDSLREEITAVLQVATSADEVVVIIESPGGVVTGYGLAANQLLRLRNQNIPLTVCVDEMAASGGYLMACVANKILAAPFAIVGSIGVVAGVPNLHRLLRRFDVDYKEYTAGEFKRTISFLGEITPKGEQKFLEQLEVTHQLFKNFVHKYRPQLDLAKVATGEYWYGQQARDLGLVDEISGSDEYLQGKTKDNGWVFEVKYHHKTPISERISEFLTALIKHTTRNLSKRVAAPGPQQQL